MYYRSFLEFEVLCYLENVLLATKDESEYNKIKYFPFSDRGSDVLTQKLSQNQTGSGAME